MSNDERYEHAVNRFMTEPEALGPDEIDVLKNVHEGLGRRALEKRGEYLQKAAEARHRAAMGEPPLKNTSTRSHIRLCVHGDGTPASADQGA